jgi:hypothetical protein
MWPANAVCDALNMTDEAERGLVRMLVNSLIWMTGGIAIVSAIFLV